MDIRFPFSAGMANRIRETISRLLRREKVILYCSPLKFGVTVYYFRHDDGYVVIRRDGYSVKIREDKVSAVEAAMEKFVQDTVRGQR